MNKYELLLFIKGLDVSELIIYHLAYLSNMHIPTHALLNSLDTYYI